MRSSGPPRRRSPGPGLPADGAVAAAGADPARPAARLWWWSAGLAVFALLPVLARLLVELAGGTVTTPANTRPGAEIPLVLHAVSGTVYTVLGAFQFPTAGRSRGRIRAWHPRAGRLLILAGTTAALTALWLTLFFSDTGGSGVLLYLVRLVFGVAMVACIVAGVVAIRRRDPVRHRAWMIRAYAIGLGASTQIVTLGVGGALLGSGEPGTALLTAAGWVINLGVAEWTIRRRRPSARPDRRATGAPAVRR